MLQYPNMTNPRVNQRSRSPLGDAGIPLYLNARYTAGEAKTPNLPRVRIVIQMIAVAMGLGRDYKLIHHFNYLLFH